MADRFLKEGMKAFTPAEQKELIEEGAHEGVRASNLDALDIVGTHYEQVEALYQAEEAAEELFL
jgi:hypothetical protein